MNGKRRHETRLASMLVTLGLLAVACATLHANEPIRTDLIDIGSRLELFVDQYLIDTMDGVTRELHSPERKEAVFTFDRPWEGGATGCVTVFDDGIPGGVPHYRMYYVGVPMRDEYRDYPNIYEPAVVCTVESRDGIHWTRPNLKLFSGEFIDRYRKTFTVAAPNNIVWLVQGIQVHSNDNFVPFKDSNPACNPEARYKAIGRWINRPNQTGYPWPSWTGFVAMQSSGGIHWSLMQDERIIKKTETDAQNVAFWDFIQGHYTCHTRVKRKDGTFLRSIARLTSDDFLHWSDPPQWLEYGNAPEEHLYNSTIRPYFRAPHISLGLVMRLVTGRKWVKEHPQHEISDAMFMSSRDGLHFNRGFLEGWIRPGFDPVQVVDSRKHGASLGHAEDCTRGTLHLLAGPQQSTQVDAKIAARHAPHGRVCFRAREVRRWRVDHQAARL